MSKAKIVPPARAHGMQTLDPTTLGRPLHLLPLFHTQLERALSGAVNTLLNRRYRAGFHFCDARAGTAARDERWQWFDDGAGGMLALKLERPLLLAILDYRFGVRSAPKPEAPPAPAADTAAAGEAPGTHSDDAAPAKAPSPAVETAQAVERMADRAAQAVPTETERRLERLLAQHLLPSAHEALAVLGEVRTDATLAALPLPPPRPAAYVVALSMRDEVGGSRGLMRIALDAVAFERLLAVLGEQREKRLPATTDAAFASRLRVELNARLVDKRLPLSDVLALTVGSVLPVKLAARADVQVRERRVFTATVAEHHGRLCLTAFTEADAPASTTGS
ncbi:FliM/FliN family flagellar motor switch protein [Crenobacter caeni]|uniref:Flagellar motor switch protein FliN-like C-terminal domain-containing protein n=1 Tax=Crenobacter caeni TaxID=2705474 RepID=A0A6B2KRU9_9NEIS|nr:FliM/FliN family flagellar motor switch protein [Crenobacter caeni]NDV12803.1 hypothetical protein [Crenobacter caeni]